MKRALAEVSEMWVRVEHHRHVYAVYLAVRLRQKTLVGYVVIVTVASIFSTVSAVVAMDAMMEVRCYVNVMSYLEEGSSDERDRYLQMLTDSSAFPHQWTLGEFETFDDCFLLDIVNFLTRRPAMSRWGPA